MCPHCHYDIGHNSGCPLYEEPPEEFDEEDTVEFEDKLEDLMRRSRR